MEKEEEIQKKKISIKKLHWLLPIVVWLLIFGKNIFSNFILLDYAPITFPDTLKSLYLTNYAYVFNGLAVLKIILYPLNLLPTMFTLSVLIAMLVSYFYIHRLFKSKPIAFTILFAFIYFFNPFVYTRIMVGQIGVVISFLLIPAYLYYLIELFRKDLDKKAIMKMCLAMTASSLFAIHFFAINFIIFLAGSVFFYFYKNKFSLKKYSACLLVTVSILILINLFWIQGIFSTGIFSTIDSGHEDFFSPKMSANIPAVAKIISMWGFWREGGMITSYNSIPAVMWYALLFLLIIAAITGFLNPASNKKKSAYFFFSLFWTGIILGTGISHSYTKPFFDFLFNYLPLFNGLRDSHKIVSLIVLSYAFFISSFVLFVRERHKKFYIALILAVFIFFLVFSFPLIGLWNQLHPVSYPDDYYKANSYFNSQNITGYIIYLPWQSYLTFNWTKNSSLDGRISVPINQIVEKNVLLGPDEWGTQTKLGKNISICIENQSIGCLENNNVQFIIKDRCSYYPDNYSWISIKAKAYENKCLTIYKINNKEEISRQKIPIRFIIGVIVSLITLIIIIILINNNNFY